MVSSGKDADHPNNHQSLSFRSRVSAGQAPYLALKGGGLFLNSRYGAPWQLKDCVVFVFPLLSWRHLTLGNGKLGVILFVGTWLACESATEVNGERPISEQSTARGGSGQS
jgi:hypothetical protein